MQNMRTSFMVDQKEFRFLSGLIEKAGLRRDTFIANALQDEVEELKAIETNTEEAADIVSKNFILRHPDQTKINILLPRNLVESLNEECRRKNIHRSCFFNRFIEFLNVRCGLALLTLAAPRKTLNAPQLQWLKRMAASSPAIMDYVAYIEESMQNDGDAAYIPFEGDPYWDDFYSRILNVAADDPRRLTGEEQSNLIDRILDGDLEVNDETA